MTEHHWDFCEMCDCNVVICGKCGNNTCNAGYGDLPDGTPCDACPSAYELSDREWLSKNSKYDGEQK